MVSSLPFRPPPCEMRCVSGSGAVTSPTLDGHSTYCRAPITNINISLHFNAIFKVGKINDEFQGLVHEMLLLTSMA